LTAVYLRKKKENGVFKIFIKMIGHCHCQHYDLGTTNETFKLKTEGQIERKSFIYFLSECLNFWDRAWPR
jgi:hypothetical protein